MQLVEVFDADRLVNITPPDIISGRRFIHYKTVVGRAARVLAGQRNESAMLCQLALRALQRAFKKFWRTQIPMGMLNVVQAVNIQPEAAGSESQVLQNKLLFRPEK